VIAWPELHLAGGQADALDTVLAECPGAQRLVATADDGGIAELIARHARRAPVVAWSRLPQQPSGTARYVVVPHEGRAAAVRGVLDALNPGSALVWDPLAWRRERWQADYAGTPGVSLSGALPSADAPVDLVLAVDLPPPEVVSTAMPRAAGVVALVRAAQLPYLRRVVRELAPLRLPGPTDLARQRLQALHQRIRDRIVDQDRTGDLLALEPLFDEFDPALVAAALVAVPPPAPESELAAWVRLHVSVGRRDRVRPADLLGALINGVGLPKDHVGRIDIREGFSLVEIRAGDAARAVQGLTGLTLRGRRVTARPERG